MLFTLTRQSRWDEAQVVVQRLDTGERTPLVRGTDGRYISTGHLVYGLEETLFAVALNPSTLEPSSGSVSLLQNVGMADVTLSGAVHFALSRDGMLAYVPADAVGTAQRPRTLVWVDRQGREEPINAPPRSYVYPRLSPDGRHVAVDIRDRENDIWIWDMSGSTPLRQLTFGSAAELYVIWADNRSVIYSSGPSVNLGSARALFRRGTAPAGAPEELVRHDRAVHPNTMAPDGGLIFRQLMREGSGDPGSDLMLLPLNGDRRPRPLFKSSFNELNAEMSRDGTLIAYQSNKSGESEIWVRSYPNVDALELRVTNIGGTRPMWSHSGQELFFSSRGALMSVPVTRGPTFGNPRMVLEPKYFMGGTGGVAEGRTYDIDRDDRRFLMIKDATPDLAASSKPRLVVIQDWFEELRTRVTAK